MKRVKAISVWEPWASWMRAGLKRNETRDWPMSYRGPLLIYAAKCWTRDQQEAYAAIRLDYPSTGMEGERNGGSNQMKRTRIYEYQWKNNAKRATMFGRSCRIIATGKAQRVHIEFLDNGQREYTTRKALRLTEDK